MKSQLFASAAFVLLSAVPGALSAEEANLQGAVAVTSFEDQLADFFDEEEVSDDEDEDYMDLSSWSGKSGKAVRNVRSKIYKDGRAYSGKSEKDDRDYSGKSGKADRDSRDKGGKSDKPDFFNDEEASEDEDFILTDSGKHHHDCVYLGNGMWACGGGGRGGRWWGKSGGPRPRGSWRPKSDKESSEDEDFILTDSGKHHHWGKGTHRVWYGKSGHRVVWRPKSDKEASEDEGYETP